MGINEQGPDDVSDSQRPTFAERSQKFLLPEG